VYEGSFPRPTATSEPTFVVGGVLDGSYSNRSEVDLNLVLICISFMAKDGEIFFMCCLATWISSFEKVQLPISYWFIDFLGV
jgi:hypothetical protein